MALLRTLAEVKARNKHPIWKPTHHRTTSTTMLRKEYSRPQRPVTLLPAIPGVTTKPKVQVNYEPPPNFKPKRQVVLAACEPCRKRKSKVRSGLFQLWFAYSTGNNSAQPNDLTALHALTEEQNANMWQTQLKPGIKHWKENMRAWQLKKLHLSNYSTWSERDPNRKPKRSIEELEEAEIQLPS